MTIYVYKPRPDGSEPVGTEGHSIWRDLKTREGAVRRALRFFGPTVRVFEVLDDRIYSDAHYREVTWRPS